MKTQIVSLSQEQPALFIADCDPCPRFAFCQRSARRQCGIPDDAQEAVRYWQIQRERVALAGGQAPQALPPVRLQPRLAKVTHIIGREAFRAGLSVHQDVGIYARNAVGRLRNGLVVRPEVLEKKGLHALPKALVISDRDDWLAGFFHFAGNPFAASVLEHGFTAVMGPNLSGYHEVEHWVWLDNRALCQLFMGFALRHGLPGIFHTYLENSPVHQDWLVEYLKLNPTQHFIATGFDRNAAKNLRSARQRIRLLAEVERRAGRPLQVVCHNLMTSLRFIKLVHAAFPHRVHLLGRSVVMRSYTGSSLIFRSDGTSDWIVRDMNFQRGMELFNHNARRLEETLANFIPGFFDYA
jgi:hypothetical protein